MTTEKRSSPRKGEKPEPAPQITPMPFPGESPTVSLAMAAGRMYGLQPEEEKAARPKRRAKAASKKAVGKKVAGKPARSGAKPKTRAKRATRPRSR